MITLEALENSVKFTFTDSDHYLYGNGTIEVPKNSLALVTDSSEMFTFKKAATNDPFISAKYSDIGMTKAELEAFYMENMVGGEEVDPEEVQQLIDQSISGNVKSVTPFYQHSTSGDTMGVNVTKVDGSVSFAPIFKTKTGNGIRCYNDTLEFEESFLSGVVTSAIYDSSGKTIELKNVSGVTVSSIDATDFIKDGMVSNVEVKDVEISGETVPCLAITFNTDAGHQEIDIPLSEFFDSSKYYSKEDTDALLSGKTDESAFTAFSASTEAALSGKQDTLIAGDGITISGNEISWSADKEEVITKTFYQLNGAISKKQDVLEAGEGIDITDNVISVTGGGGSSTSYKAADGIRFFDSYYADTQGNEQSEMYDISDPFYAIGPFDCPESDGFYSASLHFGEYDEEMDEYETSFSFDLHNDGTFEVGNEGWEEYFNIEYVGNYHCENEGTEVNHNLRFFLITPIQTVAKAQDESCARFIYQSDVIIGVSHTNIEAYTRIMIPKEPASGFANVSDAFYAYDDGIDMLEFKIDVDGEHVYGVNYYYEDDWFFVTVYETGEETSDYEEYFSIEWDSDYKKFYIVPNVALDEVSGVEDVEFCLASNAIIYDNLTTKVISGIANDVSNKVDASAITSSITSASTDTEIPTAKAVFDAIPQGASYSAGTNISIDTANTISCTLPISATGSDNRSIKGGRYPNASGQDSFVYGSFLTSQGNYQAVFGNDNTANLNAQSSFICGGFNSTKNSFEAAFGKYNICNTGSTDADNTLFSVGNGSSNSARHNAFEIRKNGDIYISSGGTDIKLQDNLGGGSSITVVQTTGTSTTDVMSQDAVTSAIPTVTNQITSGSTDVITSGAVYDAIGDIESLLSNI